MRALASSEIQAISGGATEPTPQQRFFALVFNEFLKNPISAIGGVLGFGLLVALLGPDLPKV